MKGVTIIGSGLAGSLLALYLARRGYHIELYESRPDLRKAAIDAGRSINLAMSCRGLTGLTEIGLRAKVTDILAPMRARAIHEESGEIKYQPFGRHNDEYINAVQRNDLNALLLNELELNPAVNLYFDTRLTKLDVHNKTLYFSQNNGEPLVRQYERLIGADGSNSFVRETLCKENLITATRTYMPHGYKELSISGASPHGLAHEHLHLWPRDSFLLLGNPNCDHSVTGSLFLPHKGKNSFAELDNELAVTRFFSQAFADVYDSMPDLTHEFLNNPTGTMSTINCSRWYYQDNCLLIGDAAHGIVPFFGQGMNCAFEDCRVLNGLLDQYHDDWQKVMPAFFELRKKNTEAVAKMSMDNYHEIQSNIRNEQFNFKKRLNMELMKRYPETYISKHVLVMFTNTPYAEAEAIGEIQEQLLNQICETTNSITEINWNTVTSFIKNYDKKLANLSAT
ncbi:FAD-dependent oxidoreductase [Legionella dresdenensis]|uniref:FAD-dependent oxidoreductase n=1 Tax=Legionella dresdenensis TaxID=450200 RepID=A0ABV8CC51_9GAMM